MNARPVQAETPAIPPVQRRHLWLLYAAYGSLLLTGGVGVLVGVIMTYILRGDMRGTPAFDHTTLLLRTFWFGLLGCLIAVPLLLVLIGWPLLLALAVWYHYRLIAGAVKLAEGRPVDPGHWPA